MLRCLFAIIVGALGPLASLGSADDGWETTISKALDKDFSVSYVEQSLSDIVVELVDRAAVPILLDASAMADIGIEADVPLTCELNKIPLRSVLEILLRPLDLTTVRRDGVLLVTTDEEAECDLDTRFVDVRDLVRVSVADSPVDYDYDSLIDLVTGTIAPDTWDVYGGPGSCAPLRGGLVISQTEALHQEIVELLTAYREARDIAIAYRTSPPDLAWVGGKTYAGVHAIESQLAAAIDVDYFEYPLNDIVADLQDRLGINVVLDTRALDDLGVSDDVPVTFAAKGIRASHALNHVLADLNLTCEARHDVLVITSLEESECNLLSLCYPIADLCGKPLPTVLGSTQREADLDDLIHAVTSTVAADTWDCVGGPGTIEVCHHIDVLVVSQTQSVHDQIGGLLRRIRAGLAKADAADVSGLQVAATVKPELRLHVYHVPTASRTSGKPTEDIAPVIPESESAQLIQTLLMSNKQSDIEGGYIRAQSGRLLIRHTDAMHRDIQRLLERLRVAYMLDGFDSLKYTGIGGGMSGSTGGFGGGMGGGAMPPGGSGGFF